MRRFWFWFLPVTAALVLSGLFAAGFFLGLTGRAGRTVDSTPEPEPRLAPPSVLRILILGDSLARGTGDATALGIGGNLRNALGAKKQKVDRIVNLAVNGSRTGDVLRQLESANVQRLVAESNVIVVSIGGNDLFGAAGRRGQGPRQPPQEALDEIEPRVAEVVRSIREHQPDGRIFLVGLYNPFTALPHGERVNTAVQLWNARVMERFSDDPNFTLVQTSDLFSHRPRLSADQFHPGAEAYRIIAQRIADSL